MTPLHCGSPTYDGVVVIPSPLPLVDPRIGDVARYNTEWLIERLGHQTPVAVRAALMAA